MKTKAKPIPADASLSLGKTAGYWTLVHDGAFADRSCHPDGGGICRAKLPLKSKKVKKDRTRITQIKRMVADIRV